MSSIEKETGATDSSPLCKGDVRRGFVFVFSPPYRVRRTPSPTVLSGGFETVDEINTVDEPHPNPPFA